MNGLLRRGFLVVVAIAVTFAGTPAHAGTCGGSVTFACGDHVMSAYTLPADLDCSGPSERLLPGLVVHSGVALDCAGHSLKGGRVVDNHGIVVDGMNTVSLTSCRPTDFDIGIRIHGSVNIDVANAVAPK